MSCTFCDAKGVKIEAIIYKGAPANLCQSCKYLDGIKGDDK